MENLFKQNLLRMRRPSKPTTFSEALLGGVSWGNKPTLKEVKPRTESFTEKVQVLESLERFAQEKFEETKTPVIKFDLGEIHLRPEPEWRSESFEDLSKLKETLTFSDEVKDILFKSKSSVKAIFVTENFRSWDESKTELKGSSIDELILQFPLKTAEFFGRMVLAMKLEPSEVITYPVAFGDQDLTDEVMKLVNFYSPEVVITLGALATQKILKSNDRLSTIHGQFFTRKINDSKDFTIVPLFHPTIIETNQNHKKAAWADMQKIMRHLKKLP